MPLKGVDLAIRSYSQFLGGLQPGERDQCKLTLVGSGPEEKYLKSLAVELGNANSIQFINWIERDQLMEKFKASSAFLFPSHEGAGMVVAEALSFGLPVICLDNEGPGQFINSDCSFAIPHDEYADTVKGLANAIQELFITSGKKTEMSRAARKQFETFFHWNRCGEQLRKIYAEL